MGHHAAQDQPAPPAPGRRDGRRSPKTLVREVAETLLLALVIFLSVRTVGVAYEVDGESMAPNLHDHQRLFVARAAYAHLDFQDLLNLLPGEDRAGERLWYPFDPPERGDIVVFDPPVNDADEPYVKRVIGLPGDRITFWDGRVRVNGEVLEEPYVEGDVTFCEEDDECGATVEEGEVFVLGDNREHSRDSRAFGPVPVERIVGKAVVSLWPLDDAGRVPDHDYPDQAGGP